jgi:hypothetical protein
MNRFLATKVSLPGLLLCALNISAQNTAPPPAEKRVALRTATGYYITAENGGGFAVHTDRAELGPWETFTMVPVSPGVFAFRTENGNYLSDMAAREQRRGGGRAERQPRTALAASGKAIDASTQFRILLINPDGNIVTLMTSAGRYLTAENNGGIKARGERAVSTDRTEIGPWEQLQLVDLDRDNTNRSRRPRN